MHNTGGWTVGNLDEFEGAMRIIAEESGHQVSHAAPSMHLAVVTHVVQAGYFVFIVHNQHGSIRHADPQERPMQNHALLPSGPACIE